MPRISAAVVITFLAWDTGNSVGKTGDAANITLRGVVDGTVFTPAGSIAEVDATYLKGLYKVTIAAGENTGAWMSLGGISSSTGVVIAPVCWSNESNAAQISGSATAADNVEANIGNLDAAISGISASAIADAVWDEALSGHTTGGTAGSALGSGGVTLTAAAVDSIVDETYEGSETLRQFLRLARSVLLGKSAGGGTTTNSFRDAADAKNRVQATVDVDGNRTAVSVDAS